MDYSIHPVTNTMDVFTWPKDTIVTESDHLTTIIKHFKDRIEVSVYDCGNDGPNPDNLISAQMHYFKEN